MEELIDIEEGRINGNKNIDNKIPFNSSHKAIKLINYNNYYNKQFFISIFIMIFGVYIFIYIFYLCMLEKDISDNHRNNN